MKPVKPYLTPHFFGVAEPGGGGEAKAYQPKLEAKRFIIEFEEKSEDFSS